MTTTHVPLPPSRPNDISAQDRLRLAAEELRAQGWHVTYELHRESDTEHGRLSPVEYAPTPPTPEHPVNFIRSHCGRCGLHITQAHAAGYRCRAAACPSTLKAAGSDPA